MSSQRRLHAGALSKSLSSCTPASPPAQTQSFRTAASTSLRPSRTTSWPPSCLCQAGDLSAPTLWVALPLLNRWERHPPVRRRGCDQAPVVPGNTPRVWLWRTPGDAGVLLWGRRLGGRQRNRVGSVRAHAAHRLLHRPHCGPDCHRHRSQARLRLGRRVSLLADLSRSRGP